MSLQTGIFPFFFFLFGNFRRRTNCWTYFRRRRRKNYYRKIISEATTENAIWSFAIWNDFIFIFIEISFICRIFRLFIVWFSFFTFFLRFFPRLDYFFVDRQQIFLVENACLFQNENHDDEIVFFGQLYMKFLISFAEFNDIPLFLFIYFSNCFLFIFLDSVWCFIDRKYFGYKEEFFF